jgi:hypothetical protein
MDFSVAPLPARLNLPDARHTQQLGHITNRINRSLMSRS